MGLISKVRDFFMNLFMSEAKEKFNVKVITSDKMEIAQLTWSNIIKELPPWLNPSDGIETINFAKFLCQYTAKKTCIDLKVTVSGSERADYINKCISYMVQKSIRDKIEDACGLGGIILKPNGTYNPKSAIDYILPGQFVVTDKNSNGDILGAIFLDKLQKGDKFYTRLEYHHFENVLDTSGNIVPGYTIENKAYKSNSDEVLGTEILLNTVEEWSNLEPIKSIHSVDKPLFAYVKMPYNNTIDYSSPEGVAIFANCHKELKDLDIAWSRKSGEVKNSKKIIFLSNSAIKGKRDKENPTGKPIELPEFVQGLEMGIDADNTIKEHVPTILTEQRITDINSILSMISTKCGFSQGQFILDRKTGRITATQIESDDSETVETITDIRTALKSAVKDLIYAIDKYCDIYFDMDSGYVDALDESVPDENIFYFKDLLSTFEQDRTRAYQLMQAGVYSKVKYLVEFEGFDETEALEMLAEAQEEKKATQDSGLF